MKNQFSSTASLSTVVSGRRPCPHSAECDWLRKSGKRRYWAEWNVQLQLHPRIERRRRRRMKSIEALLAVETCYQNIWGSFFPLFRLAWGSKTCLIMARSWFGQKGTRWVIRWMKVSLNVWAKFLKDVNSFFCIFLVDSQKFYLTIQSCWNY